MWLRHPPRQGHAPLSIGGFDLEKRMNAPMIQGMNLTMSSREIAELTGKRHLMASVHGVEIREIRA